MEIELKLGPAGKDVALALYNDTDLLPPAGAEEVIPMKTIYYDTPDRDFAARKETLRLRQEGDRSVCCLDRPAGAVPAGGRTGGSHH